MIHAFEPGRVYVAMSGLELHVLNRTRDFVLAYVPGRDTRIYRVRRITIDTGRYVDTTEQVFARGRYYLATSVVTDTALKYGKEMLCRR